MAGTLPLFTPSRPPQPNATSPSGGKVRRQARPGRQPDGEPGVARDSAGERGRDPAQRRRVEPVGGPDPDRHPGGAVRRGQRERLADPAGEPRRSQRARSYPISLGTSPPVPTGTATASTSDRSTSVGTALTATAVGGGGRARTGGAGPARQRVSRAAFRRLELRRREDPGVVQPAESGQLGDQVRGPRRRRRDGRGRCGWGGGGGLLGPESAACCCSTARPCACRLTAFAVAWAVPATTAVRATVPSRPGRRRREKDMGLPRFRWRRRARCPRRPPGAGGAAPPRHRWT